MLRVGNEEVLYIREVIELLGVGAPTLYRCMKRLGIEPKPLGKVKVITYQEFLLLREHCKPHGKRGRPPKRKGGSE